MTVATLSSARPEYPSTPALFLKFLRFGCLAFGGPIAQIAMVRQELVEREGWITPERFNRLLAVMQLLPGPEAHELCVHMGMIARGRIGGLLAGLGFMLPGLALMLLCGWAYVSWIAGQPLLAGLLLGVQAAVLGIILRAVHRIGSHQLGELRLMLLAGIAFAATVAGLPFWVPLLVAGLVHPLPLRTPLAAALAALVTVAAGLLIDRGSGVTLASAPAAAASAAGPWLLFIAGLKGGLLTFGGAYTAIPYVRADTVGRGWLSDAAFLDGVAIAGMLPAPLVIFGTFVGFVAGGWAGALALTLGMFLPAFAFSLLFFERLEAVLDQPRLHRLLDGIASAVVGIIAATLVQLLVDTLARADTRWPVVLIFALATLAAWRLRGAWVTPAIVAAGGVAGWLLFG